MTEDIANDTIGTTAIIGATGVAAADIAELGSRIGLHGALTKADVIDPIFNIVVATSGLCGDKPN